MIDGAVRGVRLHVPTLFSKIPVCVSALFKSCCFHVCIHLLSPDYPQSFFLKSEATSLKPEMFRFSLLMLWNASFWNLTFIYFCFSIQSSENLYSRKKRSGPHDTQTHPGPFRTIKLTWLVKNLGSQVKTVQPLAGSCLSGWGESLQFMCRPLEWELV